MAINDSHPDHIAQQSATRRRVTSKSSAHTEHFSRRETAVRASPPNDPDTSAVRLEPASPVAPMNKPSTDNLAPLTRELTNTRGIGQLPELLTMAEICAFLKVKPSYIYSLTATDRIPHRKFGGTLRFVKTEILQWIDRGRRGPRMSEPPRSDS